jgi:hypothetical protein
VEYGASPRLSFVAAVAFVASRKVELVLWEGNGMGEVSVRFTRAAR